MDLTAAAVLFGKDRPAPGQPYDARRPAPEAPAPPTRTMVEPGELQTLIGLLASLFDEEEP